MKTCLHGKEDLDLKTLFRKGRSRDFIKERIQSVVFDRPEEHFLNRESVPHNDFVMTEMKLYSPLSSFAIISTRIKCKKLLKEEGMVPLK